MIHRIPPEGSINGKHANYTWVSRAFENTCYDEIHSIVFGMQKSTKYEKNHFNLRKKKKCQNRWVTDLVRRNRNSEWNALNYFRRFELYTVYYKNNSIPTNTCSGWIFILACITCLVLVLIDLVCLLNWCIVWNPFNTNTSIGICKWSRTNELLLSYWNIHVFWTKRTLISTFALLNQTF